MKMDIKKKWPIAALSLIGLASTVSAARNDERCAPEQPNCYPDDCTSCYCLGPDNYGANAPVCPKTCDGDFWLEVSGFYWNSHQDGMEYAIRNKVDPNITPNTQGSGTANSFTVNNIIDASLENPDFNWNWGFKAGVGYCSPCDGWDVSVLWTWYKGNADSHIEADKEHRDSILTLWSGFASTFGGPLHASHVETNWKLELNLVDIELGRQYWVSKYLTMRPFVGVRYASIKQDYNLEHRGGSWTPSSPDAANPVYHNEVKLNNDYEGAGLRGGLDTVWNLGCGWGVYGDMAFNILYGNFTVDHDEVNRAAGTALGQQNDFRRAKVTDTEHSFYASRAIFDLGLGVQWAGMFCDCKYGFLVSLGWEHHLFMDQNQLWREVRTGDVAYQPTGTAPANNTGENTFHQRRGDLDTQGWTLRAKFDF